MFIFLYTFCFLFNRQRRDSPPRRSAWKEHVINFPLASQGEAVQRPGLLRVFLVRVPTLGDTGTTCQLHTERPFRQPHPGCYFRFFKYISMPILQYWNVFLYCVIDTFTFTSPTTVKQGVNPTAKGVQMTACSSVWMRSPTSTRADGKAKKTLVRRRSM